MKVPVSAPNYIVSTTGHRDRHRYGRRSRHSQREDRRLKMRALGIALLAVGAAAVLVYGSRESREESRGQTPVYGYDVAFTYPHDETAFTEGFLYRDGFFYESTGLEGESSVRQVDVQTGRVLRRHDVPRPYFGEGLTDWGFQLVQLTYTTEVAYMYDLETFAERSTFKYKGQGWGLTHDDHRLIMSDGSANLRFLDPETHRELGAVEVRDRGTPVTNLNELEFIRGDVYANVWHSNRIAVIDPKTGNVREWIDLTGLNPNAVARSEAVLNGIAYDASRDRLFVTGKWWQSVYEIRVRRGTTLD
jgi:glutaminyl-peptide cyclotransferase